MTPQDLIQQLIKSIGDDPSREGLLETPSRVIKSYKKLFEGYKMDPKDVITVFDSEKYDEMIICKDIEIYSTCEHHMLPFFGKAHIGYIPRDKIVGLSKMPRLAEVFARRLQTQERLTYQIAETIKDLINPIGVGVIIEAKHLCMMARCVEKQRSEMVTSAMLGAFKNSDKTRSEFLKLIKN